MGALLDQLAAELDVTPDALRDELLGAGEALQPTYLTVDAAGKTGANFTGDVHAQGLTLDVPPPPGNPNNATKIRWLRTTDGALIADMFSTDPDNNTGTLVLDAYPSVGGTGQAQLTLQGAVGVSLAKLFIKDGAGRTQNLFLIQSDGTSDFSVVRTLLTPAQFPPANPGDGQECHVVVDAANGIIWRFRFRSAGTANKQWEFIGGPPLFAEIPAEEQDNQALITYQALTTAGPSIALPLAGDYDVWLGCRAVCAGQSAWMSYDIGGTGAVDADGVRAQDNDAANNILGNYARLKRKTGLTAVTLTAKYRHTVAGTSAFYGTRWMSVTPVRCG